MNEVKKRFVKMTCKSCNEVTVMEYEQTTADEYNVTMGVQMGCNDALEAVSQESGGILHHKIKEALKRLRDEFGFGIPDKETLNDN